MNKAKARAMTGGGTLVSRIFFISILVKYLVFPWAIEDSVNTFASHRYVVLRFRNITFLLESALKAEAIVLELPGEGLMYQELAGEY